MGMISASRGTIWTTISMTTRAARPRKLNRAAASAARKARASEISTVARTTRIEFWTSWRKCGLPMAERKFSSVPGIGSHLGSNDRMSTPRLKPVATIQ
jgi:hypothetical protein